MKRNLLFIFLFVLFAKTTAQPTSNYPAGIEHVVVIGIDGMSVEGLKKAPTPHMDRLMASGVLCDRVRTVQPSSSASNWAAMFTGVGPEINGVTSNDWKPNDHELKPPIVDELGYFPSVLGVIRAQRPHDELGMLYNWSGFGELFAKQLASYEKTFATEKETAEAMAAYIRAKKPVFLFSQLDEVDGAGHKHGHMTEGYLQAITKADALVGEIIQAIDDAGMTASTLVLVVADHGGIGYGHGGTNTEEITVPFILSGKGIKKNYVVPTDVYIYDVAPTITFALGLKEPYAWRGKAIRCAFEGFDAPTDFMPLKRLGSAPLINGGRQLYDQAGALLVDQAYERVTITPQIADSKTYYTTDGTEPTSNANLYTGPLVVKETTVIKAKSFANNQTTESHTATGFFRFVESQSGNGLNAAFYAGKGWSSIPKFADLKPSKTFTTHEVRANTSLIDPLRPQGETTFGIVYTGKIAIDQAGTYTFYLQSDDGSKLYIDGKLVVNNDGDHGVIEKQGDMELTAGKHDLCVEFINAAGGYWIEAFYRGPGLCKQIIPANKLFVK